MIAEFDETVFIKADAKSVFAYIADVSNHPLWSNGLREVSPSGPLREGEQYRAVNYQLGQRLETNNLVTKLRPGEQLEIVNHTGPIEYTILYTVEPAGAGAQLNAHVRVESDSPLFSFGKGVFEFMARSRVKADLDSLKGLAESHYLEKHRA